ncbi:DUF3472 domain-containing protein [Sodalis praecaptivus]|uniref:DUF3472 domain-containing protein n=1 Tax=Sodalis praecaptivus TaxID=1239307 RepID=UPI0027E919B2|nr:hypothetical protein [Sodalis praecaptivus]CAJ0995259.1 hypothetical protein NVIRENTERO_01824 [Sodalis praecaptivus]
MSFEGFPQNAIYTDYFTASLLYRVYQNNLPLPGRSVTAQKGYPGDKLYNAAVWKTIEALRKDILKGVNGGEKVAVPTCGPGITACFNQDQAELIYVEHDAPNWDDEAHHDYSGYYFNLGERGGFAGIQRQQDPIIGNFSSPCHALCIIGEGATARSVTENAVQLEWSAENMLATPLGGNDTGRRIAHPMPWHADIRYATVIRRWYVAGERRTHLAMFSYAFANGTWTHYFSASVPGADISFSGYHVSAFRTAFPVTKSTTADMPYCICVWMRMASGSSRPIIATMPPWLIPLIALRRSLPLKPIFSALPAKN